MDFFFGLITLLIPIFGIFTTRLYYNAWNRQLLFYIPIFWFPPFSIIPAILVWLGKFKKNPTKLSKNVIYYSPNPDETWTMGVGVSFWDFISLFSELRLDSNLISRSQQLPLPFEPHEFQVVSASRHF